MHDERRKLRQLDAAVRLRALQREKAEMVQARAKRAMNEAEQAFSTEMRDYQSVLDLHAEQKRSGIALDPFLYEQRLLMQLAAHADLQSKRADLAAAKDTYQASATAALSCKVKEDLVRTAHEQTAAVLQAHRHDQESIDIFDAQQSLGDRHGL